MRLATKSKRVKTMRDNRHCLLLLLRLVVPNDDDDGPGAAAAVAVEDTADPPLFWLLTLLTLLLLLLLLAELFVDEMLSSFEAIPPTFAGVAVVAPVAAVILDGLAFVVTVIFWKHTHTLFRANTFSL
jgi:hypothetical protein